MDKALAVGLGGFLGSVLRYGMSEWIGRARAGLAFPIETLLINTTGCLVLGFLAGLGDSRGMLTGTTRAFLFIGVLGGFTTYSAFGFETWRLLRDGQWTTAGLSVALQVVLGIGGVWAGHLVAGMAKP